MTNNFTHQQINRAKQLAKQHGTNKSELANVLIGANGVGGLKDKKQARHLLSVVRSQR